MKPLAAPAPATPRRVAVEVGGAFVVATGLAAALYPVGALRNVYAAIIAGLLLYVPAFVLRRHDLGRYGATARPVGRSLLATAIAVAVLFPLFAAGYLAWQRFACAAPSLRALAPGPCAMGVPWPRFHPRLPADALELALSQLIVVALPEEFFFRGFVQGRLAEVWPARRWGGAVAGPIVAASALFALCHVAVQQNPATAVVFFPGLVFGLIRARTGSLLGGTLFHALCNLYIEALHRSFFG